MSSSAQAGMLSVSAGKKRKASDVFTHSTSERSRPQGSHSISSTSSHGQSPTPDEQLAGYALEILGSTSGTRHHAFGILMRGLSMELWYYDAAGIISTENTISMEQEFGLFAAVIIGFYHCSTQRWGHLDIITHSLTQGTPSTFPLRTLEGGTIDIKGAQIVFKHRICCQCALVGHRTAVYGATVMQAGKPDLLGVIKMSYQVVTWTPEWEFIQKGQDHKVEHLPEVIACQDFTKFSGGVWGALFPGNGNMYEDRVLRMIVFPQYTPIYDIIDVNNFASILHQLVDCE